MWSTGQEGRVVPLQTSCLALREGNMPTALPQASLPCCKSLVLLCNQIQMVLMMGSSLSANFDLLQEVVTTFVY